MSAEPHPAPPRAWAEVTAPVTEGPPRDEAPAGVVVQILATEHWSLLATRSMLWSELMSRISIHLTISSAALVVLALVAQATGFGPGFWVMAIGLSAVLLLLGTLTLLRVTLGSLEDHRLVAAMNRLRGAYGELDPGVLRHFATSSRGDGAGVAATYSLGNPRPMFLAAYSSTLFFLACFNAIVAGTLTAIVTFVSGGPTALVAILGVGALVAYAGTHTLVSRRLFRGDGPAQRRHVPAGPGQP